MSSALCNQRIEDLRDGCDLDLRVQPRKDVQAITWLCCSGWERFVLYVLSGVILRCILHFPLLSTLGLPHNLPIEKQDVLFRDACRNF